MANNLLKGNRPDIISANVQMLKDNGYSHARALKCALCHANKKFGKKVKQIKKKFTFRPPVRVTVK